MGPPSRLSLRCRPQPHPETNCVIPILDADFPPVGLYDGLGHGEPDTASPGAAGAGRVRPIKPIEQPGEIAAYNGRTWIARLKTDAPAVPV